jgi:hypothetical protein
MCATNPFLVAQWWRRLLCATTTVRLREKGDGARRSITPFPNGALMAQWHTRAAEENSFQKCLQPTLAAFAQDAMSRTHFFEANHEGE